MQVEIQDVGFGFSPYPHELARDPRVSLQAKGLFAVYGSFVKCNDPTAWPSEEYLCKLCGGINGQTFRKYKRELLDAGWISQLQRHKGSGRFSTVLVTRYYHPSLNPHCKPVSTVDEKTDVGKTDVGKTVDKQKQPSLNNNHKDTRTKACVPVGTEKLTDVQSAAIEWTIQEYKKTGRLRNEEGLRRRLTQEALKGGLGFQEYLKHIESQEQQKKASEALISRVDEWKQEAAEQPVDWEEMKKQFPRLFIRSTGQGAAVDRDGKHSRSRGRIGLSSGSHGAASSRAGRDRVRA